jgi:hypothetical protein
MITRSYDHRGELYLTAIGIIPAAPGRPARGLKYRKIRNQPAKIYRFEKFLRREHPMVSHVNYYGRRSQAFCFQHWFENDERYHTVYEHRPTDYRPRANPTPIVRSTIHEQTKIIEFDPVVNPDWYAIALIFDQYVAW